MALSNLIICKSSAADELRPRLLAFPFCACHADVGRHAGGFSKAYGSATPLPSPSHYVAPGGGLAQRQIRNSPTVSAPLVLLGASTKFTVVVPFNQCVIRTRA